MNLAPRKLAAAHDLLLELLANGPQPVSYCLAEAAARGLSQRTVFEARRTLGIVCIRFADGRPFARPGLWKLVRDAASPQEWKRRALRFCRVCGEAMPGAHWLRRRCRECGGR
jgi:hypothetical protein